MEYLWYKDLNQRLWEEIKAEVSRWEGNPFLLSIEDRLIRGIAIGDFKDPIIPNCDLLARILESIQCKDIEHSANCGCVHPQVLYRLIDEIKEDPQKWLADPKVFSFLNFLKLYVFTYIEYGIFKNYINCKPSFVKSFVNLLSKNLLVEYLKKKGRLVGLRTLSVTLDTDLHCEATIEGFEDRPLREFLESDVSLELLANYFLTSQGAVKFYVADTPSKLTIREEGLVNRYLNYIIYPLMCIAIHDPNITKIRYEGRKVYRVWPTPDVLSIAKVIYVKDVIKQKKSVLMTYIKYWSDLSVLLRKLNLNIQFYPRKMDFCLFNIDPLLEIPVNVLSRTKVLKLLVLRHLEVYFFEYERFTEEKEFLLTDEMAVRELVNDLKIIAEYKRLENVVNM